MLNAKVNPTIVRFFRGGNCDTVLHLFSMVSFFTCTRPNRSRVGAIDKPDRPEQVFDQYDIPEDPEKNFTNDFSMACHEKMFIFGDSKAFRTESHYNESLANTDLANTDFSKR